MDNKQYYWKMSLWNGETVRIKPELVDAIKSKLGVKGAVIRGKTRVVNVSDIRDFSITSEVYIPEAKKIQSGVLDEASRVFGEPQYVNESIKSIWVKKSVPYKEWTAFFSHNPAYRVLEKGDSSVTISFKIPSHMYDPLKLSICTSSEVAAKR